MQVQIQALGSKLDKQASILLSAERLFALRGYHQVTIREIAKDAGVPLALVGYYFGPKQGLLNAIFEHWKPTIDARLSALAQIQLVGRQSTYVARIVSAFVDPVLTLRASAEGEYYALLVARELYSAIDEAEQILREYFDPLAHAFIDALQLAYPNATRVQVAWCYQFALGALLHHISDSRVVRLSRGKTSVASPKAREPLIQFIAGGFQSALGDLKT